MSFGFRDPIKEPACLTMIVHPVARPSGFGGTQLTPTVIDAIINLAGFTREQTWTRKTGRRCIWQEFFEAVL